MLKLDKEEKNLLTWKGRGVSQNVRVYKILKLDTIWKGGGGGGVVSVFKILKLDTIQKKKITYQLGSPPPPPPCPHCHPILQNIEVAHYIEEEELTDLEVGRGKGSVSECQSLQNTVVRRYIIVCVFYMEEGEKNLPTCKGGEMAIAKSTAQRRLYRLGSPPYPPPPPPPPLSVRIYKILKLDTIQKKKRITYQLGSGEGEGERLRLSESTKYWS